jgi:hypothetical protein
MNEWALRCIGVMTVGATDTRMVGMLVKAHDPNMRDGRGWTEWTDDERFARRFRSPVEALDFWRQQSTVRPLRPDGKPNRPLTAYSIEVVKLCQTEDHATVV